MRLALTGARGYVGAGLLDAMPGWTDEPLVVPEGELSGSAARIQCDVLVHAAGGRRRSRRSFESAHVGSLAAVLRRLPDHATIVLLSSRAVYGSVTQPVGEDAAVAPATADGYAHAKAAAEALLVASGRRAVILRLTAVAGCNPAGAVNGDEAVARIVRDAVERGEVRVPRARCSIDPVYVGDVVDAVRRSVVAKLEEEVTVINIAGPRVEVYDLASHVRTQMARRHHRACRIRTEELQPAGPLLDTGRARSHLGWVPTKDGLSLADDLIGAS